MTTEDFKKDLMELVHKHAGDDHLEDFSFLADSIIASAKGDERARIKYELGTMYGDSVVHGPTLRAVMEPRQ